jgi:hypothetical protein
VDADAQQLGLAATADALDRERVVEVLGVAPSIVNVGTSRMSVRPAIISPSTSGGTAAASASVSGRRRP